MVSLGYAWLIEQLSLRVRPLVTPAEIVSNAAIALHPASPGLAAIVQVFRDGLRPPIRYLRAFNALRIRAGLRRQSRTATTVAVVSLRR